MFSQLIRLNTILVALNNKYGHIAVTSRSLAEKLDVCDKTISRDIQELNWFFNTYLIDNKHYKYDYNNESDPIFFDWSKKSFRIRDEFLGVKLSNLLDPFLRVEIQPVNEQKVISTTF